MNPPARRRLDLHRHDAVVVLDQELDLGAFCQAIFASFSELRNREIASFSEMRHSGSALLKSAKPEQAPLAWRGRPATRPQVYRAERDFPRHFHRPVVESRIVAPPLPRIGNRQHWTWQHFHIGNIPRTPPRRPFRESTTTMNEYAYSAKLVFKVTGVPKERGRWLCEERIIRLTAPDDKAAYADAVRIGRGKAFRGWRFLGVANLIRHDPILSNDEVWYELKTSKEPERLVPPKRIVLKNAALPSSPPLTP